MVKLASCHLHCSTSSRINQQSPIEACQKRKNLHRAVRSASFDLVLLAQEPARNVDDVPQQSHLNHDFAWQQSPAATSSIKSNTAPVHQHSASHTASGSTYSPSTAAHAITSRIAAAQQWQQVADIVNHKGTSLSSVHVAAALTRLARVVPGERLCKGDKGSLDKLTARLMQLSLQNFNTAQPQALSNIIWAVAKLGISPTKPWMTAFLQASRPHLHSFKPQHLSMTIWAFATLMYPPFKPWLEDYYASCIQQASSFTAQGLCITLWGIASLSNHTQSSSQFTPHWVQPHHAYTGHHPNEHIENGMHSTEYSNGQTPTQTHTSLAKSIPPPPVTLIENFLTNIIARLPQCTSQNLSNALWALAVWQHRPSASWLDVVLPVCRNLLPHYQPQGFANTIWALAKLGICPDFHWLAVFWAATGPSLSRFQPQHLSSTLWALAALRIQPPDQWRAEVLQVVYDKLGNVGMEYEGQALSNTLWAISQLGWCPEPQWLELFAARTREGFVSMGPQSCSNLMVALARLHYRPKTRWRKAFAARTLQILPRFTPQGLAGLLWAVSRLGLRMPQEWLQSCTEAVPPILPAMNEKEHSLVIWALAKKRLVLQPEWLNAFELSTQPFLPSCQPQHLCNMMWSFARLRHRPADAWLLQSMHRAEVLLPHFKCQDCSNLLWALAIMQYRPSPDVLQQLLNRFLVHLPGGCTNQELAQVAWAVEALTLQPSQQWLATVVGYTNTRMGKLNLLTARSLLRMLVACKCDPGPEYLAEMARISRNLHQHSMEELPQQRERCFRDIGSGIRKLQAASTLIAPGQATPSLDSPSQLPSGSLATPAPPARGVWEEDKGAAVDFT